VNDKISHILIAPEVGMAFDSEEKAYDMYNDYAGVIGFSIRKSTTRHRPDGSVYQKHLVCSCEGYAKVEPSKGVTRTGCDARIQFSVSKEGIWSVQKVVLEHNHYLASPIRRKT
jgi:zinc finger SWIM domain-containing protein 3